MTPEFQSVIDDLFCSLIDIIQRSGQMSINELTVELTEEFDRASRNLDADREWQYCKYAMVAWVDSEIISNHKRWKDNTLEAHYFRMGNAYTEFFLRAQKAYDKKYFNAYEVFFICFMFGYHGVYQTGERSYVPKGLPSTDVEWQEQASRRLARIRQRSSDDWDETQELEPEHYQLTGFSSFVNNLVFFCFAIVFVAMLVALFLMNGTGS